MDFQYTTMNGETVNVKQLQCNMAHSEFVFIKTTKMCKFVSLCVKKYA